MRGAPLLILLAVGAAASAQRPPHDLRLAAGTPVALVTKADLSSKTSAKGDIVALLTSGDIVVEGKVAIPAGTAAAGEIVDSRGTGGLGSNGRLEIAPRYIRVGDVTIRLEGRAGNDGKTKADTVIGLALLTPVISGRTAVIKAGTPVSAVVMRPVYLPGPQAP